MVGTFLLPFRHLPLDHARIDSVAARVGLFVLHLPEQAAIPRLKRLGRPRVTLGQAAFQDLETPGERQPIRVHAHRGGGLEHQRPDHEMAERQGINLLHHSRWRLAAQLGRLRRTPRILVGLLFVEDEFLSPYSLHGWRRKGWLHSRQLGGRGGPWAVWVDPTELDRLRALKECPRLWNHQERLARLRTPGRRGD
jgi:hypothetical protein